MIQARDGRGLPRAAAAVRGLVLAACALAAGDAAVAAPDGAPTATSGGAASAFGEAAAASTGHGIGDGIAEAGAARERAFAKAAPRARRIVRIAALDVPALYAEDAAERKALGADWKRRNRVGVMRDLRPVVVPPTPARWGDRAETLEDGSRVFRIDVEAPGATGIRLRFRECSLPVGSELTVSNAARPGEAYGPLRVPKDPDGWLGPTVFGERAVLALRVPVTQLRSRVRLVVDGVAQRYRPAEETYEDEILGRSGAGKTRASGLGCMNDVVCDADYSATVSRGVVRFEFTQGGSVYLCSGTLLNDLDTTTQVPWLLTANHCVSTDKSAKSMEIFWDYKSATCGGSAPQIFGVPRTLGATLVATTGETDCTLVRITGTLPSNRYFCGWTATRPSPGDPVIGVHHPEGTDMRISYGNVESSSAHFHTVVWRDGVTAEGSSGSAIFNADKQVVGQLCCGASYCNRPRDPDDYGRFDQSYPAILSTHLGAEPAPPGPDAWDPGDDTAPGATAIGAPTLKGIAHGPHTLNGTDAADWFAVDLTAGVPCVFDAVGAVRADLFSADVISNESGVQAVATTAGGPTGFSLIAIPTRTGPHYLRVQRATPGTDATYDLGVAKQDTVPPKRVGSLRAAVKQGTVKFTWADKSRDELGYRVELLGPGGWVRIGELPANSRRFSHRPGPGAQTYRVGPYDAIGTNWREVHVVVRGKPGRDAWDPGDDTGAGATPLGVETAGETPAHELDRNDIADWFRIEMVQGETWTFETDSDGDTLGGVFADAGGITPLADADDQEDPDNGALLDYDFRIDFTAPATGSYWIQVRSYPSKPKATYTLRFTLQ